MATWTIGKSGVVDFATVTDFHASGLVADDDIGVIQDSVDYEESVTFSKRLTLTCVQGATPRIHHATTPLILNAACSVLGSATGRIKLESTGGAHVLALSTVDVGMVIDYVAFETSAATVATGFIHITESQSVEVSVTNCTSESSSSGVNAPGSFIRISSGKTVPILHIDRCETLTGLSTANTDPNAGFLYANTWGGYMKRCVVRSPMLRTAASGWTHTGQTTYANNVLISNASQAMVGDIWALYIPDRTDIEVLGNTMIGPGDAVDHWFGIHVGAAAAVVKDNIVYGWKTGFFAGAGVDADYNCYYANNTDLAGGTSAGANDVTADPLFVGAGDYHITGSSPCHDTGMDSGETPDADGRARPIGPAYDMGAYELPLPVVVSATCNSRTVVVVTLDSPVPAGLDNTALWTLPVNDGLSDPVAPLSVVAGADFLTITTDSPMTPGGLYSPTTSSSEVDPTQNSAQIAVNVVLAEAAVEPLHASFLAAIGTQVAKVFGVIGTRLTQALGATDTEAFVETTLDLPSSGIVGIGGEMISYSGKTGYSLTGLVRDLVEDPDNLGVFYPADPNDKPIGTGVVDFSGLWSSLDQAKADLDITIASDRQLLAFGRDRDLPIPLSEMSVEDYRGYLQVSLYLKRTTWVASFRVLREMFRWASESGSNGSAVDSAGIVYLVIPTASLTSTAFHDKWMVVKDTLCRVKETTVVATDTVFHLEPADGTFWEASPLVDGETNLAWELLGFRITPLAGGERVETTGDVGPELRSGSLLVRLFIPRGDFPATYLKADATLIADDRPIAGKVMTDYGSDGKDIWGLYLGSPYKTKAEEVLREVVASTVAVRVEQLAR